MPTHAGQHVNRPPCSRPPYPRLKSEDPPFTHHLQRGSHATVKSMVLGCLYTPNESLRHNTCTPGRNRQLRNQATSLLLNYNFEPPGQNFGDLLRSRRNNWNLIASHQLQPNSKPASPHKEATEPFLNNAQEISDQLDCHQELFTQTQFQEVHATCGRAHNSRLS